MMAAVGHIDVDRLRCYSSAFSRHCFEDILRYDDFDHLDWLYHSECGSFENGITYLEYLQLVYRSLAKDYRCEYIYKNEIIHHLIRHYRSKSSVIFNEFRVGDSVADLAFFNGESRAFEIKTEYDSDKRLCKQLQNYCRLFDKCFLVIPHDEYNHYAAIVDDCIGIIALSYRSGRIVLRTVREAQLNSLVDVDLLMSCCRTSEYELMRSIPTDELKRFFLSSVKRRKSELQELSLLPRCLRQICLSLNLREKESAVLIEKLNSVIS